MSNLKDMLKWIARQTLPKKMHGWLSDHWYARTLQSPVGWIRFGTLRRLKPVSPDFGVRRGLCIDRYYIERFLSRHTNDIRGRVLEIGDRDYTVRFGGQRVSQSDVLHFQPGNSAATIVADLTRADEIPDGAFDCIILTQTLQFIYDTRAALQTVRRILKPGGVLLATFPGISQISRSDMDLWGDYWRFTSLSSRRLFEEIFSTANVSVESCGNVLAAICLLHGITADELRQTELAYHDPDYEVLLTVRAVKSS